MLPGFPLQTAPIKAAASPDGARLALVSISGADDNELTVRALETGAELLRLPSDSREWVHDVCWSPDGRQIAFPVSALLQRQGTMCIRIVAADSGALVRTVEHGSDRLDWSRRNKFVIEYGGDPDVGIAVVDIATGRQGWTRLGVGKQPSDARWSPDGTVLACTMNDFMDGGHATSIMGVRPVKAGSELWLIAKNGESPAWRPTSAVTN